MRAMQPAVAKSALALLGIVLLFLLARQVGIAEVLRACSALGWSIVWLGVCRLAPHLLDSWGWRLVIPGGQLPGMVRLVAARWVAESVNTLLPVAQMGGHLARVRMLLGHGRSAAAMGAGVVADMTLGIATQALFAALGLVLLLRQQGFTGLPGWRLAAVLAAGLGMVGLLVVVQRAGAISLGAGIAERFMRRRPAAGAMGQALAGLLEGARSMDALLAEVYSRRGRLVAAGALRLAGWISRAGEVWLAMYLLGAPVGLAEALVLESLSYAAGSAAFLVPGAIGVRDGVLVGLGAMLGIAPELGLALALAKRGRELLLGVPGLAFYFWSEGRRNSAIVPRHEVR